MTNYLHQGDLPADAFHGDIIAVDTETMGLNQMRDALCLVQLSSGDGDAHLVQLDRSNYNAPNLKQLLSNPKITKIFHYARFDMAILKHHFHLDVWPVYCTKIVSKLVRTYTENHGLKDLSRELLGHKMSKAQQSSDWGIAELSREQIEYAASDVLYLHKMKEKLDTMLQREGRTELARQCFDALPIRVELDLGGWHDIDIFAHSSAKS